MTSPGGLSSCVHEASKEECLDGADKMKEVKSG
jgi:hypothetical protein